MTKSRASPAIEQHRGHFCCEVVGDRRISGRVVDVEEEKEGGAVFRNNDCQLRVGCHL